MESTSSYTSAQSRNCDNVAQCYLRANVVCGEIEVWSIVRGYFEVPNVFILLLETAIIVCHISPLPGDKSETSDQTFPCLLEVQTHQVFILSGRPYP